MKNHILNLLAAVILFSSCASSKGRTLNCEEYCSLRDMVCNGITSSTGVGSGYSYQNGSMSFVTSGTSISCRPPNQFEKESLEFTKEIASEIHAENEKEIRNGKIAFWSIYGLILLGAIILFSVPKQSENY
jgi:hypothetical protein